MLKTALAMVFVLKSFFLFSQSSLKDFIKGFPNMKLNVDIECDGVSELQNLDFDDGARYLSARSGSAPIDSYYKMGKIVFDNGNWGLFYAVKSSPEGFTYAIDIMNKKGEVLTGYPLGLHTSSHKGDKFQVLKVGKKYRIWVQKGTGDQDIIILGEMGIREYGTTQ